MLKIERNKGKKEVLGFNGIGLETGNKINRIKDILIVNGIKNDEIFSDEFLSIPGLYLPGSNADKEWVCLIASWKRFARLEGELDRYSVQNAKMFQNLRDKGFVMSKTKSNYTCRNSNNEICRMIRGWVVPKVNLPNTYVRLNYIDKQNYISGKRDPYTMSRKNLQIDHRTPRKVSKEKFLIEPAILTSELIRSGKADELFQVISSETNSRKREICEKCLDGKDILLPEFIVAISDKYKSRFDNICYLTNSCVGCFWFDPKITQEDVLKKIGNKINLATPSQLKKLANHFNNNQ